MAAITTQAAPAVRPRITVISSSLLGEKLDSLHESFTFERLTGAVEHRAWDGQLVAISINGKHYVNRDDDLPSPVKLVQ
jgi:hypothetical protein